MDVWQLFHTYNKLAVAGVVDEITCDCSEPPTGLITRLGKDGELVLWCMTEDASYRPGQHLIDTITNTLKELGYEV